MPAVEPPTDFRRRGDVRDIFNLFARKQESMAKSSRKKEGEGERLTFECCECGRRFEGGTSKIDYKLFRPSYCPECVKENQLRGLVISEAKTE